MKKKDWSCIYNQPSYPNSFVYEGLAYYLKSENIFYRYFRTEDGRRVGASRIQEKSLEISEKWVTENYPTMSDGEKFHVKLSLQWMDDADRYKIQTLINELDER